MNPQTLFDIAIHQRLIHPSLTPAFSRYRAVIKAAGRWKDDTQIERLANRIGQQHMQTLEALAVVPAAEMKPHHVTHGLEMLKPRIRAALEALDRALVNQNAVERP